MPDHLADFTLKKWYLDVADANGNAYIGYWAQVRWKALQLHFYQHFFFSETGGVHTVNGFAKQPEPVWSAPDQLAWQAGDLRGAWHSQAACIEQELYQSERGSIRWTCYQPRASATVQLRDHAVTGWGYTELIEMSVPAWQLPLETLYWGRAHSQSQYWVWIEWQGETSQKLLWHNGSLSADFTIDEQGLTCGAGRLSFGHNSPLRRGEIGQTIFKPFRKIVSRFPVRVLRVNEQKYYSRGLWEQAGEREETTIIYEKVTF